MIIIHSTATVEGVDVDVETIRKWHLARDFSDIGYNYVILLNGELKDGRKLEDGGAHTSGYNSCSIGIAYVGGCDNEGNPKNTLTDNQDATLVAFIEEKIEEYKDKGVKLNVYGHNDLNNTACPSFDVTEWIKEKGLDKKYEWLSDRSLVQKVAEKEDNQLKESEYVSPNKEKRDAISRRVPVHRNSIYRHNGGGLTEQTLFSDCFYYLQNGYDCVEYDADKLDVQRKVKTLIYLHTIPFDYDTILRKGFFNNPNSKHGGVELVPKGYLALLGGLIWRKKWSDENEEDPIEYGYTGEDGSYFQLYERPKTNYDPLFHVESDKTYKCSYARHGCDRGNTYNVSYYDFVNKNMDLYTENRLIAEFNNFVNTWYRYLSGLELRYKIKNNNQEYTENKGVTYATYQSNGNENRMTYLKMKEIVANMAQSHVSDSLYNTLLILTGREGIKTGDTEEIMLSGFTNSYAMGFIDNGSLELYYSDNNNTETNAGKVYNAAFSTPVLVLTSGCNNINAPTDGSIHASNYMSYLNGFCDTIDYYLKIDSDVTKSIGVEHVSEGNDVNDFKYEIYGLLKSLWDRWLCGFYNSNNVTDNNYFKVGSFFNDFVFIDTFYNNISSVLRLNCRLLQTRYEGSISYGSKSGNGVINHLGGVVSDHQCAMFNFPDFANFCSDDEGVMYENLKNMFVAVPQNQVGLPSTRNKFVVVYTHSANSLTTIDRNKFIPDTFDIWSYDEGREVAPSIFNGKTVKPSNVSNVMYRNESRMAYKVPAFGVAYSRQDNCYWKNVKVGMDTQTITEQAGRALSQIAEKGNSSKRKITFYGQDIYSIYQAYSYIVTIEMMGNVQIQPLMYFQLMNIPMFRGTYMVIKVEHNLKVGDMTTTFTGMKMSKVQKPFTTSWFAITGPETNIRTSIESDADSARNGHPIRTVNNNAIDISDNTLSDVINKYIGKSMKCDVFVRTVYKEAFNVDINNNLEYNGNKNMFTELSSDGKWNMNLFRRLPRRSNNWEAFSSVNTHPEVGEILFGYHNGKLDGKHMHVAIYLGMHEGQHYVAEGGDWDSDKSDVGMVNDVVQVAAINTSMMCNGCDIYTHHALCTSVNIEQMVDSE